MLKCTMEERSDIEAPVAILVLFSSSVFKRQSDYNKIVCL